MKITLLCVGKSRETWINEGLAEYVKRLGRYARTEIITVADERAPENLSPREIDIRKDREADRILRRWPEKAWCIAMDPVGSSLGSEGLAKKIEEVTGNGESHLLFVVGGSLGLSPRILRKARLRLSFGPHVFPHQLFRVMLLEQIYRAYRIIRGEPYHK